MEAAGPNPECRDREAKVLQRSTTNLNIQYIQKFNLNTQQITKRMSYKGVLPAHIKAPCEKY